MKAAVYHGPEDVRVEEIADPVISSNEIKIKVMAGGICGSDLHVLAGQPAAEEGTVLCHELSGEVIEVGEDIDDVEVGDRVGVEPLIGCGECQYCQVGEYHLCSDLRHIGFYYKGGYAEYSKVPKGKYFKLPDNIGYDEASLLDCYAVAVHGINKVRVKANDNVVIIGGGPIGLTMAQVVKAAGVQKVILLDLSDDVLEIAKQAGIEYTINTSKLDAKEEIDKLTNGMGADVVIEAVGGNAPTLNLAIELTRRGGILGMIGMRQTFPELEYEKAMRKELTMQFIWSYATFGIEREFKIALDMLADGRIDAKPLITHRVALDDINEGFELAKNKQESGAVKIVVKPHQ